MNLYRCIGKNGIYALICVAKPAGNMRKAGSPKVHVYLNIGTGDFFYRDESDFETRMELVGSTTILSERVKKLIQTAQYPHAVSNACVQRIEL